MKKKYLRRLTLAMSLIMTGFFGFPGLAMAHQASISTTGPDSYNKIEFENSDKCEVENNNDVGVKNVNFQNAHTGDAVVGSNWGAYAPEAWQARGHSYEEWHAAVSAHMATYEGSWGAHSGGNTVGGNATSGNATNVNDTNTNVSIDNSGCAEFILVDTNGDGKPDKKVQKKPGQVLGSTSGKPGHGGAGGAGGAGNGHVLGAQIGGGAGGVGGQGGAGGAFSPADSGGAGAGGPGGGAGGVGNQYSISHTGPDSVNKISDVNKSYTNVENNNNVNVVNVSKQSASSGNATVSGNTKAGSAGSGGASNGNGTSTGAGIHN